MKETLEVYKNGHNYITDVDNLYIDVLSKFETRTKEFFKEIENMQSSWEEKYLATQEKVNMIIYGNKEGKKKHRENRADLYEKVVRRSKGWKNYESLSMAFLVVCVTMQIFAIFNYSVKIFPAPTTDIRFFGILSWVALSFHWLPQSFLSVYSSIKYDNYFKRSREDDKWLNNYFKCASSIIDARCYLNEICQKEYLNKQLLESYHDYSELVDEYKKLYDDYEKLKSSLKNV